MTHISHGVVKRTLRVLNLPTHGASCRHRQFIFFKFPAAPFSTLRCTSEPVITLSGKIIFRSEKIHGETRRSLPNDICVVW